MNAFVIKGTAIGLSKENWLNNPEYLTSTVLLVLQNWHLCTYNENGTYKKELSQVCRKRYGEVKQALLALENDLHNLSIIYHQLLYFKSCDIDAGLKDLYFSNLTESYFTNIRSIYDHLSCFPRIVLDEEKLALPVTKLTSFNDLLGYFDNENIQKRAKAEAVYDNKLLATFNQCRADFFIIKQIRDAIIHHGKDPVVMSKGEEVLFRIPAHLGNYNSNNTLPNVLNIDSPAYPLFEYLHSVTTSLFTNMEYLGNSIGNEYLRVSGSIDFYYGLIGICIKDFVEFLFPNGKEKFFQQVKY